MSWFYEAYGSKKAVAASLTTYAKSNPNHFPDEVSAGLQAQIALMPDVAGTIVHVKANGSIQPGTSYSQAQARSESLVELINLAPEPVDEQAALPLEPEAPAVSEEPTPEA